MGGAYSIIAINVALGIVLLGAMTAVWLYDRSRMASLLLVLAIVAFILAGAIELAAPTIAEGDARLFRAVQHMVNLVACILLVTGISAHYGLKTRRRWLVLYALAGFALTIAILDMPRDSPLRLVLNQAPLVLVVVGGTLRLALTWPGVPAPGRASRGPNWLRWMVIVALGFFAANLGSRPLILALTGTMGDGPATYSNTLYAMISQFQHAVVTMATGVVLLIALVTDLVANLRYRSGLDPLTGLLNRSGFEPAAAGLFAKADETGTTTTLVLVEADGLGPIVDRFGPQVGDEAIRALAALLRAEIKPLDVPVRLDGARFALMLWDVDDRAACQAAQARLRIFPVLAADILPEGESLTASFGVAERTDKETTDDLLERAAAALRKARRLGGDRVVSTRDLDRIRPEPQADATAA